MSNERYIETIAFMGWNIEQTREGFLYFLENNPEIRLISGLRRNERLRAVGADGTRYITIYPVDGDMMRICWRRIDQLILCDDKRREIYYEHSEKITKILERLTDQIPRECSILFYEY